MFDLLLRVFTRLVIHVTPCLDVCIFRDWLFKSIQPMTVFYCTLEKDTCLPRHLSTKEGTPKDHGE